MANTARNIEKYLDGLDSKELLLRLTWQEWLAVQPPFAEINYSVEEAMVRFRRNGYDWDMHGSLYTPEKEVHPDRAFVFFHGGAGSEKFWI